MFICVSNYIFLNILLKILGNVFSTSQTNFKKYIFYIRKICLLKIIIFCLQQTILNILKVRLRKFKTVGEERL